MEERNSIGLVHLRVTVRTLAAQVDLDSCHGLEECRVVDTTMRVKKSKGKETTSFGERWNN